MTIRPTIKREKMRCRPESINCCFDDDKNGRHFLMVTLVVTSKFSSLFENRILGGRERIRNLFYVVLKVYPKTL
jgi:hypothetical protein